MKSALLLLLLLAGCAQVTYQEVETDVVAACRDEAIRARVPHLCADPERTAHNAALAYEVLRLVRGILLP